VCAAFGRATNTDPVLWRVLFAVLSLAGGLGLFAYVLGWLLIPAEGDTGSPFEGLIGRGRSSTSPVLVVIAGIGTAIAAGSSLFDGSRPAFLVAALVVGAILLLNRSGASRPWQANAGPAPEQYPAAEPPGTGYRQPFAPYGPYATSSYPAPEPSTAKPARPPRPPSRLGQLTFSLLLLVLGVVALIDVVAYQHVPAAGYVAAALATVGVGLLIGTWFGRSRGLIALGVVLCLLLAGVSAAGSRHTWRAPSAGDVSWVPADLSQLSNRYEHGFGDATLDLTRVSFQGQDRQVEIRLTTGDLRVVVPPSTDVMAHVKVNVGNADVFGESWDGVNTPKRTITNDGPDGPGGGHLTLDIQVNAGNLEVTR
jgi:phage shock protein PspC (stress-responsive transcriptional regulator)